MRKLLASVLLALVGFLPTNAQLSFTISVEYTGSCRSEAQRIANSLINQYKPQATGIPTTQDCERIRSVVNGINYNNGYGRYSCGIKLIAGPCTGRPLSGNKSKANSFGVNQGTSNYSTNTATEIQDWSNDDMEGMLALDKNYQDYEPTNITTGDTSFDNIRKQDGVHFSSTVNGGNNFTEKRFNFISNDLPSEKEREIMLEKAMIQETNDIVHKARYVELPPMSTEEFIDYCNELQNKADFYFNQTNEAIYNLVCSSITEDGRKIQNVYIEYTMPKTSEIKILQNLESTNKLIVDGDSPLIENEAKENKTDDEIQETIQKLQALKEEIENKIKKTEGEVLFYEKMYNTLDRCQAEETFHIKANLKDLIMRQIPEEKLGPIAEIINDKVDKYFEQKKKEGGFSDEPENVVADIVKKVREIPGIDDASKHSLGAVASFFVINSPEIGKTMGHGLTEINLFIRKKKWKDKENQARHTLEDERRHVEMVNKAMMKLNTKREVK